MLDPVRPCLEGIVAPAIMTMLGIVPGLPPSHGPGDVWLAFPVAGVAFMVTGVVRFVLDVLLLDASTPMRPCAGNSPALRR